MKGGRLEVHNCAEMGCEQSDDGFTWEDYREVALGPKEYTVRDISGNLVFLEAEYGR